MDGVGGVGSVYGSSPIQPPGLTEQQASELERACNDYRAGLGNVLYKKGMRQNELKKTKLAAEKIQKYYEMWQNGEISLGQEVGSLLKSFMVEDSYHPFSGITILDHLADCLDGDRIDEGKVNWNDLNNYKFCSEALRDALHSGKR